MKKLNLFLFQCLLISLLSLPGLGFAEYKLPLSTANIPPPFSAQYSVQVGGMSMGELSVELSQKDANNWTYQSESSASGLAAVFVGSNNVTDTAMLSLLGDSIRPTFYERIRKTKKEDKSERVFYRWDTLQANSQYKERKLNVELDDFTTDKFTLQLLIMANIDKLPERMSLPIISKAKLKQYDIVKVGSENIDTVYGKRETVIVERIKDDSSYKIWADVNMQGLPLKIERIKEGDTEYVVVLEASSLFETALQH